MLVLDEVIPKYDELTSDDKAELIYLLESDIERENRAFVISPAQMQELQRRIAHADAHPEEDIPWEDVESMLIEEYGD